MRGALEEIYEQDLCVPLLFYAIAMRNYSDSDFVIEDVYCNRKKVADHCIIMNWYNYKPADVLRACMYRHVPIRFGAYVYRYIRVNGTIDYSLRILPETIEIKVDDKYVPIERYLY